MKIECAWCKKTIGFKEVPGEERGEGPITHGLCKDCESHFVFQCGVSEQEYIDDIRFPVCIVDGDGVVLSANRELQTFLGKDVEQIRQFKGGDVFECEFARLPEGCGKTVHCSGCTIRKTVTNTFQTGQAAVRVPATVSRTSSKLDMTISTEKVGNVVYLRIDKLKAP